MEDNNVSKRFWLFLSAILVMMALIPVGMFTVARAQAAMTTTAQHPSASTPTCPPAPAYCDLMTHGGPVQHQPTAYAIFWGAYWTTQNGVLDASAPEDYLQDVGGSSYANILSQYYDATGHISNNLAFPAPAYVDTQSTLPSGKSCTAKTADKTITDTEIQDEVAWAIKHNNWSKGNLNVTYFVFTPPGYAIDDETTADDASSPCSNDPDHGYCGYHDLFGKNSVYAEIVFPQNGCFVEDGGGKTPPGETINGAGLASTTAHEQFEAATDPDPNNHPAWQDVTGGQGEISDKCNDGGIHDYTHGLIALNGALFEVQNQYSNATHSCVYSLSDWSMFGYTTTGTRYNPLETSLNTSNVFHQGSTGLVYGWNQLTLGPVTSSPAVVNGIAYVGSDDGKVYAFNAATGAPLWSFATSGQVQGSPAVVNGVVYVGVGEQLATDGSLYALNATTGALLWAFTAPVGPAAGRGNAFGTPVVANGIVYASNSNESVYAFDAGTGAFLWSTDPTNPIGTYWGNTPVIANGVVYVATASSGQGLVYALNAGNGAVLQQYQVPTGGAIYNEPVVVNGVVYIADADTHLYAFAANTGTLIWRSQSLGNFGQSSPAVANGIVYVGSANHNIYAVNASNGALVWSFATNNTVNSSPAVANGVVYVGSQDSTLYALDASTGQLLCADPVLGAIESSPAVADGMVYVGDDSGYFNAFGL